MSKPRSLSIIDVDRTNEGLIVTFSDGKVVLFHTQFLYDARGADGNVSLPPIDVERSSCPSLQDGERPH